jgi:hypothetical protein
LNRLGVLRWNYIGATYRSGDYEFGNAVNS